MARALIMVRSKISQHERASYFGDLRRRRARMRAADCNFWVFEDPTDPGSFIEFTEARDAPTLAAAKSADEEPEASAPILLEVELN